MRYSMTHPDPRPGRFAGLGRPPSGAHQSGPRAARFLFPVALVLLGAVACGGPECRWTVSGVCIGVNPRDPPHLPAGDVIEARALQAIRMGLDYWGGAASDLSGYSITLQAHEVAPGGVWGWCYWDERSILLGTGFYPDCEFRTLPHEIGHALIHDAQHVDPRWQSVPVPCGP